jgi:hypothetical protein
MTVEPCSASGTSISLAHQPSLQRADSANLAPTVAIAMAARRGRRCSIASALVAQDDQLRLLVRAPRDGGQRAHSGRRDLVPVPRIDGPDR